MTRMPRGYENERPAILHTVVMRFQTTRGELLVEGVAQSCRNRASYRVV